MDNFKFSGLNFGKLRNYMRYFGSNNVAGVAKSWVKAQMNWVELGARFSNTHLEVCDFKPHRPSAGLKICFKF